MSKKLVDYLVKELVDHPEEVNVFENDTAECLTIYASVDDSDRGQVIGQGGKTAHALRRIISAAGAIKDQKIQLEIVDT